MRLAELKLGELAKIINVESSEFRDKLLEMGCVPGSFIRLQLRAPLGDPLAYELDGYTLSMRKAEALCVEVNVVNGTGIE